ncbi:P-loop containing nucleoside triphosphate hydrolase protein [Canariomyces notabilis]|uniref:P-loop containing nucleoside triphosphate hydrolase protein n=1 Tax=Canariomyces notabilis TaxID=2074819 RepID=A0AAN6TA86_9PEZI|nr:P-loop containing nucleoside triphosphate hydrolase protein [Canariomyces arenarius]
MDYHAIHGHDVSSFDLSTTHRLPTVSAAEALRDFEGNECNFISTGLTALDASLQSELGTAHQGGIQRGHVTEIWGPPGVGKTAFGIQLAANCIAEGRGVVWVDGFHRVPINRLRAVAGASLDSVDDQGLDQLKAFTHYTCPSLPYLIALLCRPTALCTPPGTALLVVDSLSALVNYAFPKLPETRVVMDAKGNKGPSSSARRLQVLQYIVSSLQKLAAMRDLAVVVLTQCATKMQAERGATLIPAINASIWDQGISTRLVLFRDWLLDGIETRGLHFAGIQKLNGKAVPTTVNSACAFTVEEKYGLMSVDYDNTQPSRALSTTPAQKRKLGDTDFEIADSDDEDYGWDDDEDAIPPMPSQWQGSEDLLLVPHSQSDEDPVGEEDAAGPHDAESRVSDDEAGQVTPDGPGSETL